MDIADVYILILHGIPSEDIPAEKEHLNTISKFRLYETSKLSLKNISRETGINFFTIRKLYRAFQDDKDGFPFGIGKPKISRSRKIESIILDFLRAGFTKKEVASKFGFCTKNIPYMIGETTIPHGCSNFRSKYSNERKLHNIFIATFAGYSIDSFSKRLTFSNLKDDTGNLISRNIMLPLTNELKAINLEIGDIILLSACNLIFSKYFN